MKKHSFIRLIALFVAVFLLVSAGDMLYKKAEGNMAWCIYIREATVSNGKELILVNYENRIPDNFVTELVMLANGEKVDKDMYPYLQKMFDDMREQGCYPVVRSGYRDENEQLDIFKKKYSGYTQEGYNKKQARELTLDTVALPGTSEHHTGLAVDINAEKDKNVEEVYRWLELNAYKYGFIKRYSQDKTEITGISDEPWHYRFVGTVAAEEIYEKGFCLEEYIEYIS